MSDGIWDYAPKSPNGEFGTLKLDIIIPGEHYFYDFRLPWYRQPRIIHAGKSYWRVPFDQVWAPGFKAWWNCTWARWVLYGGLRIRR